MSKFVFIAKSKDIGLKIVIKKYKKHVMSANSKAIFPLSVQRDEKKLKFDLFILLKLIIN